MGIYYNMCEVIQMEIWKDIKGFEGYYQVSNKGNVRSLTREQTTKRGVTKRYQGKLLKQRPNSSGYLRVELKSPERVERWFVHRLVAVHFVDNPFPEVNTIVNHLDSNFLNNAADNLEWTTLRGNMQHALNQGRLERTQEWLDNLHKALEKNSTPVIGYEPETGETVVIFKSIQECGRFGFDVSCVCFCCKGKRKTHKGLAWKYAERGDS